MNPPASASAWTACFVGSAPIPVAAGLGSPVLAIEVEIEPETGEVLEVRCSLSSQHLDGVLRRVLIGRVLDDQRDLGAAVLRAYRGPAAGAVVAALAQVQSLAAPPVSTRRPVARVMRGAA